MLLNKECSFQEFKETAHKFWGNNNVCIVFQTGKKLFLVNIAPKSSFLAAKSVPSSSKYHSLSDFYFIFLFTLKWCKKPRPKVVQKVILLLDPLFRLS